MAKILVVDDAAVDRRLAGGCVEEEGSEAIYANDGIEALRVVQAEKPDVVLTDLQMPEMDGLSLVKELRNIQPALPVILMTAWGSEETAVEALRAGAVSYVPKKDLVQTLGEALRVVLSSIEAQKEREQIRQFLLSSETEFKLGYETHAPRALISFVEHALQQINFCDQSKLSQVTTAVVEAITNARDHGNLELDSDLRESGDNTYFRLGEERAEQPPYCDRRVHVKFKLSRDEAVFVIRDEGPGFDVGELPDPTDPENLLRASGRGIMLIRTFMDEVLFNDDGNEITMIKRAS